MKFILTIFFLTIYSYSTSQIDFEKYDKLVFNAMLQFKDKEYQKSLDNFEKAIKLIPDNSVNDYFYAAAAALNLNKTDEAKRLIIASIRNTNTSKSYFHSFNEFNSFRTEKLFYEIENQYKNYISEFYQNLEHPEIYKEIDSLKKLDQEIRKNSRDWNKISQIDSLNINRLIEITKKYGWQKKGWLILWHQRGTFGENNYIWNFFKPYIDNEIKKGKIKKDFWTRYEEEKSIIKNKKQIYGFYWGQFDQYPIIDIENVDNRRAEFGLPPLWYMKKVYGIELPPEYKKSIANKSKNL